MKSSKDELMEKLDAVMGKLQKMEEEFTLQMGKYTQINDLIDQIENLEKRIEKLERQKA